MTFGMPWKKNVQCGFCIEFDRISLIVDDASCLLFFIERPTCPGHGHLVLATLPWISTCFPCRPSVDVISTAIWWLEILLGGFTTYNVCENGTTQEDHVPSSRRVFYPDLEFLFDSHQRLQIRYPT